MKAAEAYLKVVLEDAYYFSWHANWVTLMIKDINLYKTM